MSNPKTNKTTTHNKKHQQTQKNYHFDNIKNKIKTF